MKASRYRAKLVKQLHHSFLLVRVCLCVCVLMCVCVCVHDPTALR